MKNKKNVIYALILPLLVVSGLVFANREVKNETKPFSKAIVYYRQESESGRKDKMGEYPGRYKVQNVGEFSCREKSECQS
jgi:hypothetical protein